jgi:hypothetical protein
VPGGGISLDDQRWVACRPDFFRNRHQHPTSRAPVF